MNPDHEKLVLRAKIIQSVREFFIARDFLEVETPLRIPANAPEEHIEPYSSGDAYLQTSPELCMKRLLCRGYEKIFQISRCWRQGERGRRHLPEFTMLEWYRADSHYHALMDDCETLLLHLSNTYTEDNTISYGAMSILLHEGMERLTVRDAFDRYCRVSMESAVIDGSFDERMVTQIEPELAQGKPVILMNYPAEMAALARRKANDPSVAERFELYVGGMELANGFSELNDPIEQRQRFIDANTRRQTSGTSELPLPETFLKDLESMPPSAGIALGIDRLVMLFTGAERIDNVVAFSPESL